MGSIRVFVLILAFNLFQNELLNTEANFGLLSNLAKDSGVLRREVRKDDRLDLTEEEIDKLPTTSMNAPSDSISASYLQNFLNNEYPVGAPVIKFSRLEPASSAVEAVSKAQGKGNGSARSFSSQNGATVSTAADNGQGGGSASASAETTSVIATVTFGGYPSSGLPAISASPVLLETTDSQLGTKEGRRGILKMENLGVHGDKANAILRQGGTAADLVKRVVGGVHDSRWSSPTTAKKAARGGTAADLVKRVVGGVHDSRWPKTAEKESPEVSSTGVPMSTATTAAKAVVSGPSTSASSETASAVSRAEISSVSSGDVSVTASANSFITQDPASVGYLPLVVPLTSSAPLVPGAVYANSAAQGHLQNRVRGLIRATVQRLYESERDGLLNVRLAGGGKHKENKGEKSFGTRVVGGGDSILERLGRSGGDE